MLMKEFSISSKEAGQRMDKYLFKILNQASKGFVYKMLRKKNIVLNDKKATGQEVLQDETTVLEDITEKLQKTNIRFEVTKKIEFLHTTECIS